MIVIVFILTLVIFILLLLLLLFLPAKSLGSQQRNAEEVVPR